MKKILYLITQSEHGGAQTYIKDLAFYFKKNYKVIVASGEIKKSDWLKKQMVTKLIKYVELKYVKRNISLINDLRAVWELKKLIKNERPDIVHLNSSKISILGSMAVKLLNTKVIKTKVVYTAHGWVFNEPLATWKKQLYIYLEKKSAKNKNKIICVSEHDRKTALEQQICDKNKLSTIHNGITVKFQLAKNEARNKLVKTINQKSIDETEIIIGTIANFYKTKGLEYLIQAMKILVDNGVKAKVVIIGEGTERKELENWIQQLRLQKHIFLLGMIEDASSLLKGFDIYICPSIKEGLSYTMIEAMQSELPIIATNVGGNKELIKNNKHGILVEAGKTEILAQAILNIIKNKELARTLAHNAQERAIKHFSLEQMLKKIDDTYKQLLSEIK